MILRPRAGASLNLAHPLARGIIYARQFSKVWPSSGNIAPDFYTGFQGDITGNQLPTISEAKFGPALTNGFFYSSRNFSLPLTAGTCLAFVTAGFSPTDSISHYVFNWHSNQFLIAKPSVNQMNLGWANPVVVSSSGLWTAGDSFIIGASWTNTLQVGYVKTRIGTTTNVPSGSGDVLVIGGENISFPHQWCNGSDGSAIYWIAFWRRTLSDHEIAQISADPWIFWRKIDNYSSLFSVGNISPPPPSLNVFDAPNVNTVRRIVRIVAT
ncbi:MAG: hypothetical protein KGJ13_08640 [Patescibacteria group bacterium]|nr:hypothetical protein [Patescibacteria group bacterium]